MSSKITLPSLLLLPPPPQPATRVALDLAYRPSLSSVIRKLKGESGAILIVALATPVLKGDSVQGKGLSWPASQSLLAGLYTIIAKVCVQLQVATEVNGGPGSVDARVVLVDYDPTSDPAIDPTSDPVRDPTRGPIRKSGPVVKPAMQLGHTAVVDLDTFASANHPLKRIFSVGTEAGHDLLTNYLRILQGVQSLQQHQLEVAEGGLALSVASRNPVATTPVTELHRVVCVGGTFDHLHAGHKLLLTAAALLLHIPTSGAEPCRLIIGITGDELVKNKQYAEYVQSWDDRATTVINFLSSILEVGKEGWVEYGSAKVTCEDGRTGALFRNGTVAIQCVRIQDAFGPTVTEADINALVVSAETRSGATAVNDGRKKVGFPTLHVFEVDVLDDVLDTDPATECATKTESFAAKISSTAIRKQKAEGRM